MSAHSLVLARLSPLIALTQFCPGLACCALEAPGCSWISPHQPQSAPYLAPRKGPVAPARAMSLLGVLRVPRQGRARARGRNGESERRPWWERHQPSPGKRQGAVGTYPLTTTAPTGTLNFISLLHLHSPFPHQPARLSIKHQTASDLTPRLGFKEPIDSRKRICFICPVAAPQRRCACCGAPRHHGR
ncbi:hypothetical protein B0J15DRAFT_113376 [Fusarium solani]|uniref:Secreted protein n=1 Tax=Fusarium solani TaxID=169388 RepID=A0A9P9RCM7_FUSSL|nr:uncharacterized protein B0J15DRAFT_113376 [Fusarium solani]KAH7273894.1 hypothetical protein B0J15DRAFT_113376 [Fusarium solani]